MSPAYLSIIACISFLLFGYFIGSLMFGIIIGKILKKDPRNFESKNAGATNVSRVHGRKIGILVAFLDTNKSIVSVMLSYCFYYFSNSNIYLFTIYFAGIGAMIGHAYPVFFKFKGGKAVSVAGGLILSMSLYLGIIIFFIWILLLIISETVSLSSIVALFLAPFVFLIPYISDPYLSFKTNLENDKFITYWFEFSILLLSSFFVLYLHRSNIQRILSKQERKAQWVISLKKKIFKSKEK
jgi:acyl phosphate:glycerol-3-phosphate acyltransferase